MAEKKIVEGEKVTEETTQTEPGKPMIKDLKEKKSSEKKSEKKAPQKETKVKKYFAVAKGLSLPISKKHGMYISRFIKNKNIDQALKELSEVIKLKRAIPFKGEIPHRRGLPGPGRYPVNASKYFINLLKALKGNALVNGMDLDKTKIFLSSPSWARRPSKSGGRHAKRTNVIIQAKEVKAK